MLNFLLFDYFNLNHKATAYVQACGDSRKKKTCFCSCFSRFTEPQKTDEVYFVDLTRTENLYNPEAVKKSVKSKADNVII